jgi:AraC family transcriptional regulator
MRRATPTVSSSEPDDLKDIEMSQDIKGFFATIGAFTGISLEAAGLLDDVRRAIDRDPDGGHAAALRLVTLLTPQAEFGAAGRRGGLAPWQKRKVDRYLKEHLDRPMHVNELANQVSLSVSHFWRAFKKSFGATPHTHIIRLRIELAQRLMLATQDSLSHIALACGMADQSHLSKLFRRGVGETPGAWRRRSLIDAQAEARHRPPRASQRMEIFAAERQSAFCSLR